MRKQLSKTGVALVFACLFAALPGLASSEDAATSTWQCVSGAYERDIALFRNDAPDPSASADSDSPLACWVVYTKNGDSEVLWRARNDPGFCEPRMLALVETLRQSGFQCALTKDSIDSPVGGPGGAIEPDRALPSPAVETLVMPPGSGSDAIQSLLARHYEGNYLNAMVAAIPPGFSVHPDTDALTAGLGGALHVGPPNHFVKTIADGSYVLVNTLRLEDSGTSSFVNLGFMVSDKRYRFLGYATVHAASDAAVQDADGRQVSLMVTTSAAPSCASSRRLQTLHWASTLEVRYTEDSEAAEATRGCSD